MLSGIPDGRGVWGKMDMCTCMAELLHLLLKPFNVGYQFSSVHSVIDSNGK